MSKLDEVLLKRNQSWRDDISQEAKETMALLGDFLPTHMIEARTVKGYMWDGDEGNGGVYFTSNDLREASSHFIEVANWLDAQADAYNPLEACDDE